MFKRQQSVSVKTRWLLFLPLLLCSFFAVVLFFGMNKNPYLLDFSQQNKPIPQFSAVNLLAPDQTIQSTDIKGEIVLINVWASWCSVCKSEHAFLLELAKQPDISLYGLNYRDNQQNAIKMLEMMGNPFQKVIFDPEGKLALELGVYGTPETYLIDKDGIIRFRYSGALNEQRWQSIFIPQLETIAANKGESQ